MEENNKLYMMEKGKVSKALLTLGIPTMVGMLVSALFSLVDGYFVGSLGKEQMAAVSVVYPLTYVITGLGMLLGGGGSVYIAKLLGDKKYKKANIVGSVVIDSSLIIATVFGTVILIFLQPILRSLGAIDSVLPYAKDYSIYFVFALCCNIFNVTFNNLITAEGSAIYSMIAMLIGGVANVFLDPLFIFAFGMGVKGAGIATFISNLITTFIYLYFIFSKKSVVKYNFLNFKPSKAIYSEIAKVGVTLMFFQVLYSVGLAITNVLASKYGDACIAAIGITNRINSLGFMAIAGFTKGYQSFVGFNYGANSEKRVKEALKTSLIWTTAFCLICSILWIAFTSDIVKVFNSNEDVVTIAVRALRYYSVTFIGMGYIMVYTTTFLAIGEEAAGGIICLLRQGLFLIVFLFILNIILGEIGILLAQPVADGLTVLLIAFLAYKKPICCNNLKRVEA